MVGCWRVCHYEMARHSVAEKICFKYVFETAEKFKQLQLDELISSLKSVLFAEYANGVKETVKFQKRVGATILGSGAIDHYQLIIENSNGSWVMIVSEPIGTDVNRHKIQQLNTL